MRPNSMQRSGRSSVGARTSASTSRRFRADAPQRHRRSPCGGRLDRARPRRRRAAHKELGALGVKPPATTPIFYRASAARLTIGDSIEVLGEASSGEGEFVLLQQDGRLWVGAGSDHTDREVEKYGVSVSKQMCDKPIAPEFWPMVEVAPHWDKLMLRAYIAENGHRVLYQEGAVTAMLDPLDLIEKFAGKTGLAEGTLMFCGTLSAKGGVRPSDVFEVELDDPVLGRKIQHRYGIRTLPVLG